MLPGIRNKFAWDRDSLKDILHFGKVDLPGDGVSFFATQSDRLILGRLISLTMLGVYGIAFQISDVPRSVIGALADKVGYPFISKIIHLPMAEFRVHLLRYRRYALLIGALLLSMMVTWGDVLIRTLYKPSYWDAAWMAPILAVGLWHTLLYQTTKPVLFSMGKSQYNAVGNAVYCATMVISIPAGVCLLRADRGSDCSGGRGLPSLPGFPVWRATRRGSAVQAGPAVDRGFLDVAGVWDIFYGMRSIRL